MIQEGRLSECSEIPQFRRQRFLEKQDLMLGLLTSRGRDTLLPFPSKSSSCGKDNHQVLASRTAKQEQFLTAGSPRNRGSRRQGYLKAVLR